MADKALQAIPIGIGTVLCGWEVAWRHNAEVAASTPGIGAAAMHEPGRQAAWAP
jgi:hypothetical protein